MKFNFILFLCHYLFFMSLPFFYNNEIDTGTTSLALNEETSRHVVQVLRLQVGERLQITDGKGNLFTGELIDDHKKKAVVKIIAAAFIEAPEKKVVIGISLVKNTSRFEWFLEKATEIGVNEIVPLICARTEKQFFRFERMNGILTSAMLQSQQSWLPVLHEPVAIGKFLQTTNLPGKKFIAHCEDDKNKIQLSGFSRAGSAVILIGPEGDFTNAEINEAFKNNFIAVALGETRLRTETAGIVAATLLRNS